MNNLYEQTMYTAPIDYMISNYIREYDIGKANINILLYEGLISKDQYDYYYNLDRNSRQVEIGVLQRDNQLINTVLTQGFKKMMKLFFESNDIQVNDVLAIKKDAVFIINKIPYNTKFNNVEFNLKNVYTSFYKLKKLELYYYNSRVKITDEKLDVKGISDKVIHLHYGYFYQFLQVIFSSAQIDPVEEVILIIQGYYDKYINMELELGHYREFNNRSWFVLKDEYSDFSSFAAEHLPEHKKNKVDPSYNSKLIMDLYKIFSSIYFSRKKQ